MNQSVPGFLAPSPPATPQRRGERWALLALGVLLLGQLLFQQWTTLAAQPHLRPALETLCGLLHCPLPAWREPAALTLLSRDVIARPDRTGVLRVQATFRNDARWPQPWPVLVLTLSDANGRVLGTRRFQPHEYLGGPPPSALLPPGAAQPVAFDIIEPGPQAVAFDFRLE
jgi:hypothetical protein